MRGPNSAARYSPWFPSSSLGTRGAGKLATVAAMCVLLCGPLQAGEAEGRLALDFDRRASFEFGGALGRRIDANRRNWLIRAPASNPGMLGMFRLRDRQPRPAVVPWAGEFVGKYLISAVQALRMADDAKLDKTVRVVVGELISSQADDGYLGPFPKDTRLLAHWDLWGHYHCMLALMTWHDHTGDTAALDACRKAADLACRTYLDTQRRVFDAGSHEMNMAIIHALGRLYRRDRRPRYLRLMREIEKDWQRAGDYFRTGLAGVEFFRTPKPRWESLHDLQGLVELYRITGDRRYRTALLNHWHSIRRFDRRNSGAFSSGEQADGNPYRPTAIETCCTIAWMALTVDALRLTGDSRMADELELSTLNLVLAAQHPSGSWWTYNTPMGGAREASAHTIVFQSRPGTPELNCCSVNAPRGLGMLSEWAVMQSREPGGLAVNYYGPMEATARLADGTPVTVIQRTEYPRSGKVQLEVQPEKTAQFTLLLRIPSWSGSTKVQTPGAEMVDVSPGRYFPIRRTWQPGDTVTLELDMRLRYEAGDREMFGRTSVYRGPLLLAFDVRQNDFDEDQIPVLTPAMLADCKIDFPPADPGGQRIGRFAPLLTVEVPAADDRVLRLCDFATAGSTGSRYVSWLPASGTVPPPPVADHPPQGARLPPGPMIFTWRRPAPAAVPIRTHTLVIAQTPDFDAPVLKLSEKPGHLAGEKGVSGGNRLIVPEKLASRLRPNVDYYWKLIAANRAGTTQSVAPAKCFRIDPKLPRLRPQELSEYGEGPGGILTSAGLRGDPKPSYGTLARARGFKPAAGVDARTGGAVELDGRHGMLVYRIRAFPGRRYTMAVWVAHRQQTDRLGQVFSAWCRGMDDPLRVCIEKGRLFARIEAGKGYSTDGVPVEAGRWYHVAAVKDGRRLSLYVDGSRAAEMQVPEELYSAARDVALGGNPHYTGSSEHLACRLADFGLFVRALEPEEIVERYRRGRPE